MCRAFWLSIALLLAAVSAHAQIDDPFWSGPDVVNRGEDGKVYFELHHDRVSFSAQVFTEGAWETWQYDRQGQLQWIDHGDIREDLLRDGEGAVKGVRFRVNGLLLAAYGAWTSRLGTDGLGPFAIAEDVDLRATAVRDSEGNEPVHFRFDDKGYLRSISTAAQTLELTPPTADGTVRETLRGAFGRTIVSVAESGSPRRSSSLLPCLDLILEQVGVGSAEAMTFRKVSRLQIVTRADGSVALYIINAGNFGSVVFDPKGHPLLLDFGYIPLSGLMLATGYATNTDDAVSGQRAVAPDHIAVTADGRIGACANGASPGAIAAFWTERDADGATVSRYRLAPSKSGAQ
jgi:hypothetical protein